MNRSPLLDLTLLFVPLSLAWNFPVLQYAVLIYDALLVLIAVFDWFTSRKLPENFVVRREFDGRFAIGDATEVRLRAENRTRRDFDVSETAHRIAEGIDLFTEREWTHLQILEIYRGAWRSKSPLESRGLPRQRRGMWQ